MDATVISNSHAEISDFQKSVCTRTAKVFFCLDATKLGVTTPHRVVKWGAFSALITDATAPQVAAAGIRPGTTELIDAL